MSGVGVSSFDDHVHSDEGVPDHVEDPPGWLDYCGLDAELDAAAATMRGALGELGEEHTDEALRGALSRWVASAIPSLLARAPELILRSGVGTGDFFAALKELSPQTDAPPYAADVALITRTEPGAGAPGRDVF